MYIGLFFFFFNDTATTEIYTLSLHDALPIRVGPRRVGRAAVRKWRRIGGRWAKPDPVCPAMVTCERSHPGVCQRHGIVIEITGAEFSPIVRGVHEFSGGQLLDVGQALA